MIVAAAIRHEGVVYALPAPARHGNVIHYAVLVHGINGRHVPDTDQGFIDSSRGYVTREEAWPIAAAEGQLLERAPTDGTGGRLYSEDVWPGRYEYPPELAATMEQPAAKQPSGGLETIIEVKADGGQSVHEILVNGYSIVDLGDFEFLS